MATERDANYTVEATPDTIKQFLALMDRLSNVRIGNVDVKAARYTNEDESRKIYASTADSRYKWMNEEDDMATEQGETYHNITHYMVDLQNPSVVNVVVDHYWTKLRLGAGVEVTHTSDLITQAIGIKKSQTIEKVGPDEKTQIVASEGMLQDLIASIPKTPILIK